VYTTRQSSGAGIDSQRPPTIRATRVKVNSTGVVEGDIFHRTLVIEENARFEGTSRRNENAIETAVPRSNQLKAISR
jgi:cytoskeletal protein CcmA (bactofilin family)